MNLKGYYDYITIAGNYINQNSKINLNGSMSISSNNYISFGPNFSSASYGIRDNDGVLEFKNDNGNWYPILALANILDNSINGSKIIDTSITLSKINNNSGTGNNVILDNNTFGKVSNNVITNNTIALTKLSGLISTNTIANVVLDNGTIGKVSNNVITDNTISGLKITNATLTASKISGYPGNTSTYLRGDGSWVSVSGGGGTSLTLDLLNINSGGFNYLKLNNIAQSSTQIYGMNVQSFMFENMNGESAGCAANGSSDEFIIWTATDGSSICNFQDEDNTNSRVAYVNSNGAFVSLSTRSRKHSIREKNNNNILERIMKLKVKSYGFKYEFNENDSDKKKIENVK